MAWLAALLLALPQDEAGKELEDLKKRVAELEKKSGAAPPAEGRQDLPRAAAEGAKRDAGEVYSKPFLTRFGRDVHLGGYIDLEFFAVEGSNNDTFDQHRLVPFIYADVSEHVKVATEIEIEHGNGTELGVEFAHVDYWIAPLFNLRAGIILDPLGRFNLVHDAPFQDLTLRPLVNELIIPAVLREPGAGIFGSLEAGSWEFDYEVYLVNGFKGLNKSGTNLISTTNGLRNARPHLAAAGFGGAYRDFNDNKAVVGRFSASPFLGLEVGASAHTGRYDERGNNTLTIAALDLTMNLGGVMRKAGLDHDLWSAFEVVGEVATADVERDAFAKSRGVPDHFRGGFVEPRFHFMPDFLRKVLGGNDESTFTLVYRYDAVDLDDFVKVQHTVGLNYRPREDTVFKIEVQWREEHDRLNDATDDRYVASVATYF